MIKIGAFLYNAVSLKGNFWVLKIIFSIPNRNYICYAHVTLQELVADTGCVLNLTVVSHILHMFGLWGRVVRWPSLSTKEKNMHTQLATKSLKSIWHNVL